MYAAVVEEGMGAAVANSWAMRIIVSAGMPVRGAAHAGVYRPTLLAEPIKTDRIRVTNAGYKDFQ
jgi:hypothetical protein